MKKILIVEDEKPLARVMNLKLSSAGYQCVVAYNGEEALQECSKQKFDLILLDVVMPIKDGYAVLAELKKLGAKMPVVIVTSNLAQSEDIEKAKSLGVHDYFIKSESTLSGLVDKVKQYLK